MGLELRRASESKLLIWESAKMSNEVTSLQRQGVRREIGRQLGQDLEAHSCEEEVPSTKELARE